MKYCNIKGIEVSVIGFGCMRFPVVENEKIDEAGAFVLLNESKDLGINYFDSALVYHETQNETVLGAWLKTQKREEIKIATKLPLWDLNSSEEVHELFAQQLARLQVDYIDFYLLHSMDKAKWDKVLKYGIYEILKEYQQAGKIKNLGFSFHDSYEVFAEIVEARDWDFCQIQYNYLDREIQATAAGLALAAKKNLAVIVMEPLKGGLLGKLPAVEKELLASANSEATQALRWLAAQEGVTVILSGMPTIENMRENVKAINEFPPFSDEEKANVEKVITSLNEKILVPCTTCGYCLPCPSKVDIPRCFKHYNSGYRFANDEMALRAYENIPAEQRAANCIYCLQCVEKCPQKIDIPNELAKVVEKMGT